ncbi:ParB/RepB/Spo0J family partition protein [Micromonospora sp. WMMA1363]|uniref:ParB/RepB/Spo0J family partition protein n=1 Tax=Micromonospora sp. WMMA1363 TaxID=3053985 RepID=UPI00259D1A18|nr:ParB/RepB/Spo0J family partition protein [Micromonospora sp. WMMA1363]MDM4723348.1 ParB/RepB/Spo0J family partition protein [Micromonospora sp. WMMA1363]
MARRGSGLASNPLAQLKQEEERMEKAAVEAAQATGATIQELTIGEVAPDPENPESRLSPDDKLVASIKAEGQLSAGVVVPVDVWVSYGNDVTLLYTATASLIFGVPVDSVTDEQRDKAKEQIKYVINFGHRRWAAARAAGLNAYRAVVSDTLKDNTTKRIHRLTENVLRESYTPLEEAREFKRLIEEDKLGQREISRRTGIPQPYISKRIGLLNLPDDAQAALREGIIPVEAAVELAKIAKDAARIKKVIDAVVAMPAKTDADLTARSRLAVDQARKEYNAHKAIKDKADKRKKLTAEGIVPIDNPTTYFSDKPGTRFDYQIHDDDQITAAREAGTLAAYVVTGDHIEYYLTELPQPPEPEEPEGTDDESQPTDPDAEAADAETTADADSETTPTATGTVVKVERTSTTIPAPRATQPQETEEQRARREERENEEREHAAAANARAAACARIAAKAPSREALTARLARRILLVEEDHNFEAQQLAVKWLKAATVVDESTTVYTLFGYDTNIDAKLAARAAYVYDLALSEIRAQDSIEYDTEDAQHIKRLMDDAAYEPAEWEQQALLEAADEK